MASLSSYYINDKKAAIGRPDTTIVGQKYRFTIITERVIRMEYSPNGVFCDYPTERIICRNFGDKPPFVASETDILLQIQTKYFILDYVKERSFDSGALTPGSNLKVQLKDTNHEWYYGHPEVRNFGGSNFALDNLNGDLKLNPGLYSVDGFAVIDDSKTYALNENDEYVARDDKGIDLYLFMYKRDFGDCLKDYYALTGYPPMIPRYALGNWWYKDTKYTNRDISDLLASFHKEGISISALMLGSGWHNDVDKFDFDSGSLDVSQLINTLNSYNTKLGVTINPNDTITSNSTRHEEVAMYMGDGKDLSFLPLNNQKVGLYVNLFIRKLYTLGVDFIYTDYNNIKDRENLWLFNYFNYVSLEGLMNKRGLVVSRNTMIASHRYPILYSGKTKVSWNTLSVLPYYNVSAANIGISYWAHAIGGFERGTEDSELYIRYIQLGTFSPMLLLASSSSKFYKREVWKWDERYAKIMADYLKLRVKLIPYLYTESYAYAKYGIPILQPLYYTYPKIYDEPEFKNQYLLGSSMMVAPITTKMNNAMKRTILKIFMPEGIWYDLAKGKKYTGNNYYLGFYRDSEYPVFCKAGSIIPMSLDNNAGIPYNLEIQVFPGDNGHYEMYEDDGVSTRYKTGEYVLWQMNYQCNGGTGSFAIAKEGGNCNLGLSRRNYRIRFRNMTVPTMLGVYVNSNLVRYNYYIDNSDFIIDVRDVDINSSVQISYSGASIIESNEIIEEEIAEILMDAEIPTLLKDKIDAVIFSDMPIKKRRIELRKLKKFGLESRFEKMFLNLLDYMKEV